MVEAHENLFPEMPKDETDIHTAMQPLASDIDRHKNPRGNEREVDESREQGNEGKSSINDSNEEVTRVPRTEDASGLGG